MNTLDSKFYCDLDALTAGQRHRHAELSKKLRPKVIEFQELGDGYAAKIKASESLGSEIEEFMVLEKLCCPFFALELQVRNNVPNEDQLYILQITGPGDIKPFIRAEFGITEQANTI